MSATSTQIRSIYIALIVLGAIPALIVVLLYAWHFAPLSGFALSNEHGAWADFGSYVGGLLGVWFAFLAFGGVLLAVWLQTQHLKHARDQAHLDELQRVISSVASNIDSVLNAAVTTISKLKDYMGENLTVFNVISGGGTAALATPDNHGSEASRQQLLAISKDAISLQVGVLGTELDQLVWCLQQYETESGSPVVAQFYMRRYRAIVCWLDAMGFFSDLERIRQYFQPSEMREALKPSNKAVWKTVP